MSCVFMAERELVQQHHDLNQSERSMSVDLDQSMRVLLSVQELTFDWLKETYLSEPEILEYEDEDCWYHNYRSLHLPSLSSVFR